MVEIEQETVSHLYAFIIHNDCVINDHNDCVMDAFLWLQKPFIMHSRPCLCMRENAKRQEEMLFRVSYRICLGRGGGVWK